jgi:hypothetical protein
MKVKKEFENKHYQSKEYKFAHTWAQCMETTLGCGLSLDRAISDANNLITTGTPLFHAALKILGECWVYGDELLEWYELNTEYGNLLINI